MYLSVEEDNIKRYYTVLGYEVSKCIHCFMVGPSYVGSQRRAGFDPRACPCRIFGGKIGTVTLFPPNTSVFPCQYHSTNDPYSSTHLSRTVYNVSS